MILSLCYAGLGISHANQSVGHIDVTIRNKPTFT